MIMAVICRFSVVPVEAKHTVYGKLNRRLEHISRLKTNTSKYESESIVVSTWNTDCPIWKYMRNNSCGIEYVLKYNM